jgi:uncharacterized protein (DUF2235 family)
MAKRIVVCCDGTGQKLDVQYSNVVRLFSLLDRPKPGEQGPAEQVAWYHPGVGTLPQSGALTWAWRRLTLLAGSVAGYGLLDIVARAYRFVMDHYEKGAALYLFGFSRGAFAARVLAGVLHRVGVLRPGEKDLVPYALELCKAHDTHLAPKKREEARRVVKDFRDIFCWPERVNIQFLGLWDTVKAFGTLWPQSLPHTRHNPAVRTVRHALSLDERRRSFKPTLWGGLEATVEAPALHYDERPQDVKEVWFAGSHSDVGGGYPKDECGLALASLRWMICEVLRCGGPDGKGPRLDVEAAQKMVERVEPGRKIKECERGFWKLHRSDKWWWRYVFDLCPRLELVNAPEHWEPHPQLEPRLSVPSGWPLRELRYIPETGRRKVTESKRDRVVLVHPRVRDLAREGLYTRRFDDREVDYIKYEEFPSPAPPPGGA